MNFNGSREFPDTPCWIRISGDTQTIGGKKSTTIKQRIQDETVAEYPTASEAAYASGACYTGIVKCLHGLQKTAGGFGWSFE